MKILYSEGDTVCKNLAQCRAVIESLPTGVIIQGPQAEILLTNPKAIELLGVPLEQLLGKTSFDSDWNVIHEDGTPFPGPTHPVPQAIATRKPVHGVVMGVYRPTTRDRVWLLVNADPQIARDGSLSHVICAFSDITEHKRAENALRESEARYRAIVEDQTELICRFLPDGTITFLNEAYCRYFGKTRSELIGQNFWPFIPEEDREAAKQHLASITPDNPISTCEHRATTPEGEIRWQQWTDHGIFDESRRLLEFQSVGRDITKRKRAEESLRRSEEFNRRIVESSSDCIKVLDLEGNLLYISPRGQEILGIKDFDACRNISWIEFWDDEGRREARAAIAEARAGAVGAFQRFGRTPRGEDKWWEVVITPMTDARGKVERLLAISRDVTERKRVEAALREGEERFRTLADNAPVMVWMSGPDALSYFFNKPWLDFTGRTMERELGYGWADSVHQDDLQRCLDVYRTAFEARLDFKMEYRLRRWDGEYRWVLDHGIPLHTHVGEFTGYIGSCIDIHDRKQAEEALRESEARFRSVFESDVVPLNFWHADGRVLNANDAYLQLTGISREELDAGLAQWDTFTPPEHLPADRDAMAQQATGSKNIAPYEKEYQRRDGQRIPVLVGGSLLPGYTDRGIGFAVDLRQQKQAGRAIHERDQLLQAIFGSLSSHVTVLDREGVITYVSRSWEQSARTDQAQLAYVSVGVNYLDVCRRAAAANDNLALKALTGIEAVMAGALPSFTLEYPCFPPDERSWYLMHVDPMPPGHGGVVISHTDVTERKRAEDALQESQRRYSLATAAGGVGVWEWNLETNEIYVDPSLKAILGFADHEIQNNPDDWGKYVHSEDIVHMMAQANAHLEGRASYFQVEHRMLHRNGGIRWFFARGTAIRDENGKPIRIIGTDTDVTERKRAEEALHRALSEVQRLKNQLQAENIYLQEEIRSGHNFSDMIGFSGSFLQALRQISQVAGADTTVLIIGETGTGKELFARAIHNLSPRKDRPLIKVNCAALPAHLIESELFGHDKGAFTGAVSSRAGRFELADGATIFLDEVGELPLDLQSKLLRVLQEGEFERLGSSRTIKVDVRVIAATNRDLEEAMRQGSFRADLYYRLNVFPITIPPLRERQGDVPLLISHFVNRFARRMGKKIETIAPQVMDALERYHWPGNIRELQNVIERAVITTQGSKLQLGDNLEPMRAQAATVGGQRGLAPLNVTIAPNGTLSEVERNYITAVLEKTYWRIEGRDGAAEILGINPNTLRSRMRKLGIQRPKLRGG